MALGYYTATAAADPQTVCTALEGETGITAAQAIGDQDEAGAAIITGENLASPNHIVFKITGGTTTNITDAVSAVGGLEQARGYPVPA